MKKFMLTLICIGLFAITCTKQNDTIEPTIGIDMKVKDFAGMEAVIGSLWIVAPTVTGDSSPTGLETTKWREGTAKIFINTVQYSRGLCLPLKYVVAEAGAIACVSPAVPLYIPTNPNMIIRATAGNAPELYGPYTPNPCPPFPCVPPHSGIEVTGLQADVLYNIRAYAINVTSRKAEGLITAGSGWVGYGDVETIYINKPFFSTNPSITNITGTTATGGGFFDDQGMSLPTAMGLCWSTSQNPTITNAHTTQTPSAGDDWFWTSNMTGLTQGTTYYVRAYVTNAQGTWYAGQKTFSTITCPKFALTGTYITVSPTSIKSGVSSNINATINGDKTNVIVTKAIAVKYHIPVSCTIPNNNWNGTNPCWSSLVLNEVPTGFVGAYFTQQMTITKAGCPTDVQTAKVFVNN